MVSPCTDALTVTLIVGLRACVRMFCVYILITQYTNSMLP